MPIEIKICGLSDPEGVDAALAADADFVGFVFFPKSPRNIAIDRAVGLMRRARGKAAIVAMLVDPDRRLLDDVVSTLAPDFLQLHGQETPERVSAIRAAAMIPVIKAIGVASAADLASVDRYIDVADRVLLDAKPPRDATRPGGHGATFDWSILTDFFPAKQWFLSGGLNPANVAEAVRTTGAPGVDVSSGVETFPGRKDPALIHAFVAAVRVAERSSQRLAG
jgi:phosphoribosylanthranilate isomerase